MSDALVRSRATAAHRRAVVCGDQVLDHATLAERCEQVVGGARRPRARAGRSGGGARRQLPPLRRAVLRRARPPGMVLLPLNIRLAAGRAGRGIVRGARPAVLVTDRDPGAARRRGRAGADVRRVGCDRRRRAAPAPLGAGVTEDDLAVLYFTGGTTGRPKGVMLTHRNLVANSFHKTIACGLRGSRRVPRVRPVLPRRRHRSRAVAHLAGRLARRAARVRRRRRASTRSSGTASPSTCRCRRCSPHSPPSSRPGPRDVSSLRLIGHAGSPITTAVIRDAHETFPDAQLDQYYGATETASIVTCLAHEERLLDGGPLGSVGQPVVGVAVDVARRRRVGRARRARWARSSPAGPNVTSRVLGGRRGHARRRSSTVGTAWATSATSTRSATSGCSTGRRT